MKNQGRKPKQEEIKNKQWNKQHGWQNGTLRREKLVIYSM